MALEETVFVKLCVQEQTILGDHDFFNLRASHDVGIDAAAQSLFIVSFTHRAQVQRGQGRETRSQLFAQCRSLLI